MSVERSTLPACVTRARSVAKLTAASLTPGTSRSASATWAAHEAQVIPPMPSSVTLIVPYNRRELLLVRTLCYKVYSFVLQSIGGLYARSCPVARFGWLAGRGAG